MGNVEMCGVYKILNAHQRNSFFVVFWSLGALSSRTSGEAVMIYGCEILM